MPRVLIVDDATVMRTVLRTILTKNGYEVAGEAADGTEALGKYSEVRPDLVTMDIIMPKMTGLEALKQLMGTHPEAKVIMCTADNSREMVINCLKAGAKDYVIKPFSVERLLDAIKKAVGE
ncbi:MAG: response regulator [Candidatus Sericytochromatia bacterium]|uniref:Response regulator n=1 Tax=Candidatus Tanganyikabacteria bacterium TaxID=2961651 RepID=A0A937X507_9BACT|nr:response regulator [Candidatus Tanganyikabacteria bacterium]